MAVVPSSEMLDTLKYTPTWVVATVCTIIVLISLCAERGLHYLGEVQSLSSIFVSSTILA